MNFKILFSNLNTKIALILVTTGIVFPVVFVNAMPTYDSATVCDSGQWETECNSLSEEDCKILCNQCLDYFNKKSAAVQKDIAQTSQQKKTLQNQISSLNKQIQDLSYQIRQSQLSITSLGFQVDDTVKSIDKTSNDIESQKVKIAEVLRSVQEEDKKSFVEIMLTSDNLADFFDNLLYMETLNAKNNEVLTNYIELQGSLQDKKINLEQETGVLKNLVIVQGLQKKQSDETKQDRQYYLGLTEAQYQAKLKEKVDIEKKAAEISERLFELVGEKSAGIKFGEAVKLAQYAESVTGVKAAFILAIIHQESYNGELFGGNVGQCYVTNTTTGSGTDLKGNTKTRVMNPTRDLPLFISFTKALGFDYTKTSVSCWIPMYSKGVPYGWGGAMGPAQFIPSTWASYDDKVQAITGRTANPWAIKDAFVGSALLLKDNGGISDPFTAACRYYAGQCNVAGRGYANSVIKWMKQYQNDIDLLKQAGQ
jgi:peptidoglycan hydrolase CwlO-like protein